MTDGKVEPATARCSNGPATTAIRQRLPNILIVDDKPADLRLLMRVLARRGYRTRTVSSGKLALRAARTEAPDLILLDIKMPDLNGYEVCELLKADATLQDIPVIFISVLDEAIDKVKALRVGGVDYVTKPFHFEEVYARVETHLRIRSLQCQLAEQNSNLERLVAERTRELSNAYARLGELDRLKNDFLRMISHEIRTPANGVLGIGTLILDLCPASEEHSLYAALLEQSALRLRNLIEDAALISDMDNLTMRSMVAISLPEILTDIGACHPEIQTSIEQSPGVATFPLNGYHPLLTRAMESIIQLATCFSRNSHRVRGALRVEMPLLRMRLELDALSLSSVQVAEFFDLESHVRSASTAESLGLAPVVAQQILAAFGGSLRLVKTAADAGYLEASFLQQQFLGEAAKTAQPAAAFLTDQPLADARKTLRHAEPIAASGRQQPRFA